MTYECNISFYILAFSQEIGEVTNVTVVTNVTNVSYRSGYKCELSYECYTSGYNFAFSRK